MGFSIQLSHVAGGGSRKTKAKEKGHSFRIKERKAREGTDKKDTEHEERGDKETVLPQPDHTLLSRCQCEQTRRSTRTKLQRCRCGAAAKEARVQKEGRLPWRSALELAA